MADEKPKPLTPEEIAQIGRNLHGYMPLHPNLAAYMGDTDFRCPQCRDLLVRDTNSVGIVKIARIECTGCRNSWRGRDLVPTPQ